jgi:hypothetical protein
MGILHRMVNILQKIDPENHEWRRLQEEKACKEANDAFKIINQQEREERLKEISDIFENNASDYGRKLYLIENCIFGVDIQPIAVQIAKLRFFISLIIDQKTDTSKDNFGIRALPNLETKFVAANTLIRLEKLDLFRASEKIKNKENEIKQVRHEYFTANNRRKKLQLQDKDKRLRKELAQELANERYPPSEAEKIATLDLFDQNKSENWFGPEWMFGFNENECFDIVIGNPPYFVYQNEHKSEIKEIKKQNYFSISGSGKLNAYRAFLAQSMRNLLKANGILTFIFQNSFLGDGSAGKLRKYIIENHSIIGIDSFPERDDVNKRVFPGVKMSVCIFICKNIENKNNKFPLRVFSDRCFTINFINEMSHNDILKFDFHNCTIPLLQLNELDVIKRIYKYQNKKIKTIEGEINMTFHKHLLSENTAVALIFNRNLIFK